LFLMRRAGVNTGVQVTLCHGDDSAALWKEIASLSISPSLGQCRQR
jgi:hypothetical protein